MSRFLVAGTGRSGTTYCRAVFAVCGVRCTQQKVFTFANYHTRDWDWGDSEGESSFMAVPLLGEIRDREPDTTVILVTRRTDLVVASWLKRGLFGDDMAGAFPDMTKVLYEMFPAVLAEPDPESRARRYCREWNAHAARHADVVFSIETMSLPALFAAAGQLHNYDAVLAGSISSTVNSGTP